MSRMCPNMASHQRERTLKYLSTRLHPPLAKSHPRGFYLHVLLERVGCPTQNFWWQKLQREQPRETESRRCLHEVSLRMLGTAHCSAVRSGPREGDSEHQRDLLCSPRSGRFLRKFLRSISFPLVPVAAVDLSSRDEACSLCQLTMSS